MTRFVQIATYAALVLLGGWQHASAQSIVHIQISKLSYSQPEVTVHVGDTVQWDNHDPMAHTSTADANQVGGAWEVLIPAGGSASYQTTQAGSISYYCRFHPNMRGAIIILP